MARSKGRKEVGSDIDINGAFSTIQALCLVVYRCITWYYGMNKYLCKITFLCGTKSKIKVQYYALPPHLVKSGGWGKVPQMP